MTLTLTFSLGDDFTATIHSDVYPFIDSKNANLQGKTVLIVGASKNIGRAIAVSFAQGGASNIAIGGRSDLSATEKAIHDAATAAGKPAPRVLKLTLEVTDQSSIENAAASVEKTFGALDILVHNAGIFTAGPVLDSDPDSWWNTWDVNIRGPYLVTRAFLPLLLKGGDKTIVYISSVGAFLKSPGLSAYQTSKLSLLRLSEFVSAEYGERGILPFCVHPGNVPGTDILPGGVPEHLKHGTLLIHTLRNLNFGIERVVTCMSSLYGNDGVVG